MAQTTNSQDSVSQEASRGAALDRLLARDAISEILARYARGVDRADAELLASCYFEDATEEHGSTFTGNAHEYVKAAMPRVQKMGVMQHLLGSSYIDLDGDLAYVETYLWTFARFVKDGRIYDTFTGGRLIDRFERRAAAWKIAHRRTIFDWNRDTESNEGWCIGFFDPQSPGMRRGTKNRSDPSYERF
ncbi:MAG: nuclear transport factor 2 family protein [Pseudomonadota bacterium]|nr:nuclear transport factor 2 family protein [Pseudomonadota bacterium]